MTKIDETTGLAQLPEDMFWRIEEAELKFGNKNVNTLRILLMRKETVVTKAFDTSSTEKVRNGFWKHFYTGNKFDTVVTTTTIPETSEIFEYQCATLTLARRSDTPDDTRGWTKYTVYSRYGEEDRVGYYKVDEPTRDNISKLSLKVLTHWMDDRHELALRYDKKFALDKITGDYPPKSLKDLVDA